MEKPSNVEEENVSEVKEQEKDSKPIPQISFSIKNKAGVESYSLINDKVERLPLEKPNTRIMQYSNDGTLLILVDKDSLVATDSETGEIIYSINHPNISAVHVTNLNSYALTWERPSNNTEEPQKNLIIWNLKTGEKLTQFLQKSFNQDTWPSINWSQDEKLAFRKVNNEVQFFSGENIGPIVNRLRLTNISNCSLSPVQNPPYTMATFVPEKKGQPSSLKLWRYDQETADIGQTQPLASKSFFRASEVSFLWNPQGTALLLQTHTDVDKTGKSYYGESGLYFVSTFGRNQNEAIRVPLNKEGPVHDCQWSPNGREFVVSYGFMPAQTTIFDNKCRPVSDLGEAPRNSARFSKHGKILCQAGFGNLQGTMDFWDHRKLVKIGTAQSHGSAHYEWSPDSLYLLTAVLSPRLRVDNGFKIFKYNGNLVYEQEVDELFQVNFRPSLPGIFPPPDIDCSPMNESATANKTAAPAPGKYVHPNSRGAATQPARDTSTGPQKYNRQGQAQGSKSQPPGFVSAAAARNAKRNRNRKKKGPQDQTE